MAKKLKTLFFRLSDEYSMFYLKFIETNRGNGKGTWMNLFIKPSYKSWSDFAFETICLEHVDQIKHKLGISSIYSTHSSWLNSKAQIDLIIDRDDRIMNLCEMKFYDRAFTVNKHAYDNIKNKITQFKETSKARKNVLVTMITTFGITPPYSKELVTNSITMDALFEILSF